MVVDIVTSHGFFIDETSRQLGVDYNEFCDYCAITSFKLFQCADDQPVQNVVLKASNDDHVRTK